MCNQEVLLVKKFFLGESARSASSESKGLPQKLTTLIGNVKFQDLTLKIVISDF